jgi:hypothetical protein
MNKSKKMLTAIVLFQLILTIQFCNVLDNQEAVISPELPPPGSIKINIHTAGWHLLNPKPTDNYLKSIAYGNGTTVIAGTCGSILFSKDNETFNLLSLPATIGQHFFCIVWDGNKFIAAGDEIYISEDGERWEKAEYDGAGTYVIYSICFKNSMYVAVGPSGVIVNSTDGIHWKVVTVNSEHYGKKVFSDTKKFNIIHTIANENKVGWSESEDGNKWVEKDLTGFNKSNLIDADYYNGRYYLVNDSAQVFYSKDGVNWDFLHKLIDPSISRIDNVLRCDGNYLYALCDRLYRIDGNGAVTVSDNSNTSVYSRIETICFARDMYIGAGVGGTIIKSKDFFIWNAIDSGYRESLRGIIEWKKRLYVISDEGSILSSDDGSKWNVINTNVKNYLKDIAGSEQSIIAVGADGCRVESNDGIVWQSGSFATGGFDIWHITYGNSLFAALEEGGTLHVRARDHQYWDYSGHYFGATNIKFLNGQFVLLADSTVSVSKNCVDWQKMGSISGRVFNDVVLFKGNYYCATGKEVFYSNDLKNWAVFSTNISPFLSLVPCGEKLLGFNNYDGLNCINDPSFDLEKHCNISSLKAGGFFDGIFIGVGYNGLIMAKRFQN